MKGSMIWRKSNQKGEKVKNIKIDSENMNLKKLSKIKPLKGIMKTEAGTNAKLWRKDKR